MMGNIPVNNGGNCDAGQQKKQQWPGDALPGYPVLEDLFGSHEYVNKVKKLIETIKTPQLFYMMGTRPPKNIMLEGPPGTGKTYTVKVLANELQREVYPHSVLYMPYEIGIYGTAYINMGSKILQEYFDLGVYWLSGNDGTVPVHSCIRFIDECDSLLGQRGHEDKHKENDKLLNTFMINLQETTERDLNEYNFLATNYPDNLDRAAIRSGRIDEKIEFKLPDYESREATIMGYAYKVNELADYQVFRNINYRQLAENSAGLNYADLELLVDKSLRDRIDDILEDRINNQKDFVAIKGSYVTTKRMQKVLDEIKGQKYKTRNKIGFNAGGETVTDVAKRY